jgi:putative transposase
MPRIPRQERLTFKTWGGARAGAGRKPIGKRAGAKHVQRPSLDARTPVHLTMRIARGLPSLRSERCMTILRRAFARGRERFGFRLVHYAVQPDHLHFVVEAPNKRALTAGVRGLSVRVARLLNVELRRTGRVFPERYHARQLRTPREVRNALAYVLLQEHRHGAKRRSGINTLRDPYSSAPAFDGFNRGSPRAGPWDPREVPG